jgi:hypothetical protein
MASFFSKYPKTIINNKLVTDIISRTFVRDKYASKLSIYYPYELQEGDTPEIIASKYYGDPERHWIVMLANDIVDPFFDFAMDYQIFNSYIDEKYQLEANSINQWARCNWRGEWTNDDIVTTYNPGDAIVISNTAFICANSHQAKVFLEDLSKKYWEIIPDGVYWKGTWERNTDYYKQDVVQHNDTIYICAQDNLDNANNHVIIADGQFWKTYTNGVEYTSVTENPAPFTYRMLIVSTDLLTDTSTTTTNYIDEKSFDSTYDNAIFNIVDNVVDSPDISVATTKEKITIYQYESETNERKRQIKLIKKEYVPQIERELQILMGTYYG